MKTRSLIIPAMALSLLAVPALAQGSAYSEGNSMVITGSQMTDYPSMRANVTATGDFLRPGSRYAYEQAYRDRRDSRRGYRRDGHWHND